MILEVNLRPSNKQLRQFGLIALVAFGVMSFVVLRRGGVFGLSFGEASSTVAASLAGLGLLSGAFSLLLPAANRPLFVLLSLITYPIGFVVSHVVMALLFFVILTPLAFLFRAIGRDALEQKWDRDRRSYWIDLPEPPSMSDYFRQF